MRESRRRLLDGAQILVAQLIETTHPLAVGRTLERFVNPERRSRVDRPGKGVRAGVECSNQSERTRFTQRAPRASDGARQVARPWRPGAPAVENDPRGDQAHDDDLTDACVEYPKKEQAQAAVRARLRASSQCSISSATGPTMNSA